MPRLTIEASKTSAPQREARPVTSKENARRSAALEEATHLRMGNRRKTSTAPAIGFKLGGSGNVTETNRLWYGTARNPQRIGSGVIVGEHIYMVNEPGLVQCLDLKTGKEVWTYKLDYSAHAVPITWMGKNGKQYVAIVAAGFSALDDPGPPGADALVVFVLP